MTLRLKDQSLQARLDSFSNGKFSKELEECAYDIHSECIVIELDKYGDVELSVFVRPPALEKIPEYNPNDWNKYPDITPPECVWMRVEFEDGRGSKARYLRIGDGYFWFAGNKQGLSKNMLIDNPIRRFRPWED